MSFHSTLHGRGSGGAHTFIADGGHLEIFCLELVKSISLQPAHSVLRYTVGTASSRNISSMRREEN